MQCHNCRLHMADDDDFCGGCGTARPPGSQVKLGASMPTGASSDDSGARHDGTVRSHDPTSVPPETANPPTINPVLTPTLAESKPDAAPTPSPPPVPLAPATPRRKKKRRILKFVVLPLALLVGTSELIDLINSGIKNGSGEVTSDDTGAASTPTSASSKPKRIKIPATSRICGKANTKITVNTYAGTRDTPCSFALAVRTAYLDISSKKRKGAVNLNAYSSINRKNLRVKCENTIPLRCMSGDFVIYLKAR